MRFLKSHNYINILDALDDITCNKLPYLIAYQKGIPEIKLSDNRFQLATGDISFAIHGSGDNVASMISSLIYKITTDFDEDTANEILTVVASATVEAFDKIN